MEKHELTITSSKKPAICSCGEKFTETPTKVVKAWETHVSSILLMNRARTHVLRERAHRLQGEDTIRCLLELGVSARKISAEIGNDVSGNLLMSPTLILRLGKNEHVQTPRRRRRIETRSDFES